MAEGERDRAGGGMALPAAPERTDWPLVLLLYLLGLLAGGHFAKAALTLDALAARYPEAGAALPFAVSMTSVAGILFGATAGIVVARFGARRVLLAAMTAAVVLAALQALLPAFPLFLGLRLAEGFAHLAIVVAGPTLMAAAASRRDRPRVMGLWGTFFGVGFALLSVVEKVLGTGLYAVHAGALAVVGLALAPLLPRGVGRGEALAESWLARHAAIYLSARRVAAGLGFFFHTFMFMALITFLPGFLPGWTAPVLPLVTLVGTFWAGAATRRIAPDRLAIGAFATGAVLMAAFLLLPEARLFIAFPMLVAYGALPGAAFASVPWLNADPADQARANGALAQCGNFGSALTIPAFAVALAAGGLAGLAMLAIAVSALGALVVALIYGRIRADGAPVPGA